jgi:hypothetical protein
MSREQGPGLDDIEPKGNHLLFALTTFTHYRLSIRYCIAEMEKVLVNLTRTEALQSRDSIPAAAAVPRFLLRSK